MNVQIRRFKKEDIPYKVKWINDVENNEYLNYDLPLREDRTLLWFEAIKNKKNRADYTVLYNNQPVGIIGLLNVDNKNKKAEYYITIGESRHKGKGVASIASNLLIEKSRNKFNLNKIYLYTQINNLAAQGLFEKIGFEKEGLLKEDLIRDGIKIDRYIYGLIIE